MSIDFSSLVLAPAMATFGRPVLITPLRSRPTAAPYPARGIWTVESISIVTEDGGNLSSIKLTFGIRLADFTVAPKQGDWISTTAGNLPLAYWQGDIDPNANVDFIVDDFTPDGQGKAQLIVKRIKS
jgi:hypothetical protein